jgi:hypothetical protein
LVKAEWVIWYDDGSSYSSLDGPAADAPRLGTEAIAMLDPDTGRSIDWGRDWYWLTDAGWTSGDQMGVLDFLMCKGLVRLTHRTLPWERLEDGQWIASDLYVMMYAFLRPGRLDAVVLAGRVMTNPAFRALYQKIIDDPRLPPKSGCMAQEQLAPGVEAPLPAGV